MEEPLFGDAWCFSASSNDVQPRRHIRCDGTSVNASVTEVEACWMVVEAFLIGCIQWDKNSVLHDVHAVCALSECGYNTMAAAGFFSLAKWSY